jgi:hypothetical protein
MVNFFLPSEMLVVGIWIEFTRKSHAFIIKRPIALNNNSGVPIAGVALQTPPHYCMNASSGSIWPKYDAALSSMVPGTSRSSSKLFLF